VIFVGIVDLYGDGAVGWRGGSTGLLVPGAPWSWSSGRWR
jgi:hypothetical protein